MALGSRSPCGRTASAGNTRYRMWKRGPLQCVPFGLAHHKNKLIPHPLSHLDGESTREPIDGRRRHVPPPRSTSFT
jgi:hypothetical protein